MADLPEDVDETDHGSEKPEQRRELRDGREQVQFFLKPRNFRKARLLDGFTHAVTAVFTVQDGGFDEARDGPGGGIANGNGLDNVAALDDGADAVEEFGGVDLRTMAEQRAFDEHDGGGGGGDQDQPDHRPAVG